jgi:hypothetical protein
MAYPDITWDTGNMYGRTTDPSTGATTGGASGTDKLWLPIWSGEVIRAYDHYRIFEPMVESRTIASGRAMEFPITGTVAMKSAWGAGEELVGNIDDHVSKTIAVTLDARPIAAHFEIDNIDLMISQWEFRSELARQAGQTLSNARDLQVGAYLVRASCENQIATDPRLASQATSTKWRNTLQEAPLFHAGSYNAGHAAVGVVGKTALSNLGLASASDADRATAALTLLECIEEFMVHLQEINAPTAGVYCAVTPRVFHDIRALGVARSSADLAGGAGRPYFGGVAEAGGLGAGLSDGMAALSDSLEYMGCRIVKTNHLPNMDASKSGYNIGETRYNLNFSSAPHDGADTTYGDAVSDAADGIDVRAIIWQSGAVASIQKTGLKVDTVDDVRRNTVFTVASIMAGTGVLKPECAAVVCGVDIGATKGAAQTLLGMTAEWANLAGGSGYYA